MKNADSTNRKQSTPGRSFVEPLESRQLLSATASAIVAAPPVLMAQATVAFTAAPRFSPAQMAAASESSAPGTIVTTDAYSDPNIAASLTLFDPHSLFDSAAAVRQIGAFIGDFSASTIGGASDLNGPPHPFDPAADSSAETVTGVASATSPGAIAELLAYSNALSLTAASTNSAVDAESAVVANESEILDGDHLPTPTESQNIQPDSTDGSVGPTEINNPSLESAVSAIRMTGGVSDIHSTHSVVGDGTSSGTEPGAIGAVFIPRAVAAAVSSLVPASISAASNVAVSDLSRSQQIAQMMTVPAEVVMSSAVTFLPEMSRVFSDVVMNVEDNLSAMSSTLPDFGDNDSLTTAAAIADVALLAYYYNNRNRQKAAAIDWLFDDLKPTEMAR